MATTEDTTDQSLWGHPPLGHCGWCGVAVYFQKEYAVVPTFVGLIRLCELCAEKEPYRHVVSLEQWQGASANTARWRRKPGKRKGRRRA